MHWAAAAPIAGRSTTAVHRPRGKHDCWLALFNLALAQRRRGSHPGVPTAATLSNILPIFCGYGWRNGCRTPHRDAWRAGCHPVWPVDARRGGGLLGSLRQSDLYRADQHSRILIPIRALPGFGKEQRAARWQVAGSAWRRAGRAQRALVLVQPRERRLPLNGAFRNAADAARVLDELHQELALLRWSPPNATSSWIFGGDLNHASFYRSPGTFYAFEGLGSVYWHMVSKLLLVAGMRYQQAVSEGADAVNYPGPGSRLLRHSPGISFNKSPAVYGRFLPILFLPPLRAYARRV